jgi:C4-dicarboxylate transporter DctQ subunit
MDDHLPDGGGDGVIFAAVVHRYGTGCEIPGLQDWLIEHELRLGARAVHHHVRVDGQVRRRLRRAHRHPRRRRHPDQQAQPAAYRGMFILFGLCAGALFTGIIGTLGGAFVWENGAHYASFHALGLNTGDLPEGPTTPDLEWPTWIVYSRRCRWARR